MPRSANGVGASPSFRRSRGLWVPSDLDSIHIWQRSDQLITLNGADVSAWGDLTATGANAVQATALDQPLYIASEPTFNGHPAVGFDGVDHWLSYASGLVATASTNHTFFFVVNGSNAGAPGVAQGLFDTGNPRLLLYFSDSIRGEYSTLQQPGVSRWTAPASPSANGAQYLTFTFDDTAHTFDIYSNGVLTGSGSYPTGLTFVTTGALGSDVAGNSNFQGLYAEMIHYDVMLPTVNRMMVENYLAGRYAL